MDTKRPRNSQGTTFLDPINVDDDDDDSQNSDDDNALRNGKKSRLDGLHAPPPSRGSLPFTSLKCPIKLMATHGDMATRQAHWEKNSNRDHWSYSQCWTLREMLGFDQNPHDDCLRESIDWLVISNFIVDFEFLLQELPELIAIPSVVVVYGHADDPSALDAWKKQATVNHTKLDFISRDPSHPRRSSSNPLDVSIPYGCHHTKLFLIGYSSGRLRVVVHTTNLRYADVHWKCQGAFIQDFLVKQPHHEFTTSPFEETLTSYISSYRYMDRHLWHPTGNDSEPCSLMDQLCKYDFSTAKGVLIPSIPGFHSMTKGTGMTLGYLAVRQAIRDFVPKGPTSPSVGGSMVCQFSSIGSLSEKYLQTLWEAWNVTGRGLPRFQLVYPTHQEIVRSVEGIRGGGSVPGTCKNVDKPFLQSLWHKWNSSSSSSTAMSLNQNMDKGRNVPHIKTYYQVNDDQQQQGKSVHWFVLGSHNLSKAAWGELQNGSRGSIFKVFHWELGIFISPQTLGVDCLVPFGCKNVLDLSKNTNAGSVQESICEIPLPYSFRPERYTSSDQPWATDRFQP